MVEPTFVRVAAKAVIIENGALLAIKYRHENEIYYTLPGGGQRPDETLAETMARECLEEIGVRVTVHDICFIREYRSNYHEFAAPDHASHQVDCCFRVSILPGEEPGLGTDPDTRQIGVEWLPLANLNQSAFYPAAFRRLLPRVSPQKSTIYVGDVN